MARMSWVQDRVTGKLIPRDQYVAPKNASATVLADMPDFRSPIDGTMVSGRAGMRDHCARHNVVPTADLAGLPNKQMNQEYKPDRSAIRESLAKQIYNR